MIKPRRAVIEMQEYKPPTSDRTNSLRLDFNENTVGCSDNIINSVRKIKRDMLSTYPEYTKLRKELAKYCKVKADEIIATNGTDEAIKTIIETYIENGKDEIIIHVPTYAMFKFYAQLNEAVINEITYNEDLSFPAEQILGTINYKAKIIISSLPFSIYVSMIVFIASSVPFVAIISSALTLQYFANSFRNFVYSGYVDSISLFIFLTEFIILSEHPTVFSLKSNLSENTVGCSDNIINS